MTDEGAAFVKFYAAPVLGAVSILVAIFAWIINIQGQLSYIKATQETVVREQGRHEGMLQTYQERGNKLELLQLEINRLRQDFEEHRKSSEDGNGSNPRRH